MPNLKILASSLPCKPGVYQFFDKNGSILYIGKAKSLRKRVASYLTGKQNNHKVNVMVTKIADVKCIMVDSESDAFLLENTLIKKHQPKYNILLKDDKTFPWICIKNEHFPRVFHTRNPVKDGSQYFGPYTSMLMIRTLMSFIHQLYKIRSCKLSLTQRNIKKGKFKPCLEFHIGNCLGPCISMQSEEDYNQSIKQIQEILKGNISSVLFSLKNKMEEYSNQYQFEKAQLIKEKISIIEKYKSKSTVVSPNLTNIDVFSYYSNDKDTLVNYLKVVDGAVVQSHTIEVKKQLNENREEILLYIIFDLRLRFSSNAPEVIVPFKMESSMADYKITVPIRGEKRKLLELSECNLNFYRMQYLKRNELGNKTIKVEQLLEVLKTDLHLNVLPYHIECFDNSNIQGDTPVAACVVFINGKPAKKEYRHFNIKTVSGPDDYASMQEVVYRRYQRYILEKLTLPQLIIVDGGKGQLSAAYKSLVMLGIEKEMGIIGIAKKLEEIYFINDPVPLYLDKNSYSLKLIQQIRNEAHRFGITFHRQKRSKYMLNNELEGIKGIGKHTITKLIEQFKSIDVIRTIPVDEMAVYIGKSKAEVVYRYFNKLLVEKASL